MQYNETLFGAKIPAYNNSAHNNLLFNFSTKNISVQSLYHNGVELGSNFPDDLYYWQISADSPYSAMTYKNRGGSSGAYTYNKYNGEKNTGNIPIVLATGKPRRDSDYNFDANGTFDGNVSMHNTGAESLYASKIKTVNNNAPNWYRTDTLPETVPTQGFFNGTAFIADFNYNDMVAEILVGISDYPNTTLANYIANSNTAANRIKSIGVKIYAGSLRNGNSKTRTSLQYQTYNDNGVQLTQNVGFSGIVTDYRYKVPEVVQVLLDYPYPELCRTETLYAASDYMLLFSGNCGTSLTTFYQCYLLEGDKWEHPEGATGFYLKKSGNDVYNDDDFNYIRKLVAFLGFWFSDGGNISALLGEDALDYGAPEDVPTGIYQSVIEDGVTTGDFIPLSVARDNAQSKWGADFRDKNGYNGRTQGGDEQRDRGILKTTLRAGSLPTNTKNYSISAVDFNALCSWCNSGFNVTDSNQFLEDFKGLNPSECIISALYFPFAISSPVSVTQIKIGNLTADNIGANKIDLLVNVGNTASAPIVYSFNGGLPITREFGDFRDYAPYTTIDIYIPFCGSISLNPADIYNYPLRVEIIPDLLTGACVGCVYRGDYLLTTIDGQIGVPITLTLGQVGDYQNAITQAAFNLKNANRQMFSSWLGAVASVGAIASGNVLAGTAGLIGSGLSIINSQDNIKKAEYDLSHISRNFNTVGALSDSINILAMPEYAHMIIKRPYNLQGADISQYAHTVGHACNRQGYVSDFSGYTLASDIDLTGISATADELEQIRKYFATGVYL